VGPQSQVAKYRPYLPRHMFDAAKLAHSFGLKYSIKHNGCWKQDILELNAYIAYQPYKQQLPTSHDLEGGLSQDIERIVSGKDPIGFWFTASGGNAVGKLRVVYRTTNLPKKWSMDFQNIPWGDMPFMKTMDVYISCMFDANKTFGTWKNWNCHILSKHI
jgi:hypothetical protein